MPARPAEAIVPDPFLANEAEAGQERRISKGPTPTPRALFSSASLIVISQVVLGAVGVGSLPILARHFGPGAYNDFSLFVTLLGVVTYQDFARALLVAALARRDASADEIAALARASLISIVSLAAVIGVAVLSTQSAIALVIATLFFGLSSRDFAAMSAAGRVASASAMRNFAYALAFALVAGLSVLVVHPLAYTLPFVAAQIGLFLAYRSWERRVPTTHEPHGTSWLARISGFGTLRASPSWPRFRRDMLDLLAFNLMASLLVSVDRLLLAHFSSDMVAGEYNAQNDLAVKLNIFSSALGGVLLPMLARSAVDEGEAEAGRRFVRTASWAVPTAFAGIAVLILFHRTLIDLVLGPQFASGAHRYAWLLCGVFVQFFGFLITPWQRARGDFTTQRRVYSRTALVTLISAVTLIPSFGADGAVATFLIARGAEAQLFAIEVSRLPAALLPRWKPSLAIGMAAALFLLASLDLGA